MKGAVFLRLVNKKNLSLNIKLWLLTGKGYDCTQRSTAPQENFDSLSVIKLFVIKRS